MNPLAEIFNSVNTQPVFIIGAVLIVIVAIIYTLRSFSHSRSRVELMHAFVVLKVMVPKEMPEEGQQQPKDWREALAAHETLFVTLGGLTWRPGGNWLGEFWYGFWKGRHDHISLEMIARDGYIDFYLVVPRAIRQLLELQILAQYPNAQVEEVPDYNIFSAKSYIKATTLTTTKSFMYPIRTYKKLDSDPLNALTMALSKVQIGEGAAIQTCIRTRRKGWERRGLSVARQMQEGKKHGRSSSGSWTDTFTASLKKSETDPNRGQIMPHITPQEQELIKSLEEKGGKPGFEVNIRVVTCSPTERNARVHLENITNAFSQYLAPESGNSFKRRRVRDRGRVINDFVYRNFNRTNLVLNSEEINSLYHFPLPNTKTPNIRWLEARRGAAPVNMPAEGIVLGYNEYRGRESTVRMKPNDRRRHMYVIGTTGSGKTTMMEEMAKQDIRAGHGIAIIDPHGGFVEAVLPSIPPERIHDVILFDPSDTDRPMGLNMLEAKTPEERDFAVQEMISIFYKLVSDPNMIGPMFEHSMRNAMLTLMEDEEYPGTIADIPRIFTDKDFQKYKLTKVKDPMVRQYWEKEQAKTSDFHKSEMLGYLISKVGRFVENAMMRNIIGQPKSAFNFREVMDSKKILLVNLSKGKIGEANAFLLGLIFVSKLQMAALSRANIPESDRQDFFLYIDEFQNFITDSISTILSEARKYKLNMIMAHQYMGQLVQNNDTRVRDSVLGNVGTMVAFRIGVEDAEILAKQFAPTFSAYDLVNQKQFTAYIKLLIDNTAATPFHMSTRMTPKGNPEIAKAVKQFSRLRYGKDKQTVEAEILERTKLGEPTTAPPPGPLSESTR